MHSVSSFVLVLLAAAVLCSGCATRERQNARTLSVTVAITPLGARTLSSDQVIRIHDALKPELLRAGYSFAGNSSTADLVLLVSFTPIPDGNGGRVKIIGIEPTAQFRRETDGGDTPEAKEMRRRQREFELWAERQKSNYEY